MCKSCRCSPLRTRLGGLVNFLPMVKWKTTLAENKDFTQPQNKIACMSWELYVGRWIPRQMYRSSQFPSDLHTLASHHSVSNCSLLLVVSSSSNPRLVGNVCLSLHAGRNLHFKTAQSFHQIWCDLSWVFTAGMPVYVCVWVFACPYEPSKKCVGGCYPPPATLHLSAGLKLACSFSSESHSSTQWSDAPWAFLNSKQNSLLVAVCTGSTLGESHSRALEDSNRAQALMNVRGTVKNWCDKFLALGLQSQCLAGGIEAAQHCVSPAAATWCHVTST